MALVMHFKQNLVPERTFWNTKEQAFEQVAILQVESKTGSFVALQILHNLKQLGIFFIMLPKCLKALNCVVHLH